MGTSGCCLTNNLALTSADWIALLGILVNSGLAFWIVRTIQNKLTNRRVLKNHFISEIKDIRSEYKNCLNNLYTNQAMSKKVIPWFKLMNIRIDDLMSLISQKYRTIKRDSLKPYQNELREIITENEDFIKHYESKDPISFSETSKNKIIMFQQTYNHLFNDIIIQINDSE